MMTPLSHLSEDNDDNDDSSPPFFARFSGDFDERTNIASSPRPSTSDKRVPSLLFSTSDDDEHVPPLHFSTSDDDDLVSNFVEFESVDLVVDLIDLDIVDLVCCCGHRRCLLTSEIAMKQSVPDMVGSDLVGNFGKIDKSVRVSDLGKVG